MCIRDRYCPTALIYGTGTTASATITPAGLRIGNGAGLNDVLVGDRLFTDPGVDYVVSPDANNVTAKVATGSGSVTLGGNLLRNVTNELLQFWVAAPVANQ